MATHPLHPKYAASCAPASARAEVEGAALLYADQTANCTNYLEPARYARGLYDLGNQLYAYLSPNGSWQETNTGLIVGGGESVLVDTLVDLPHTKTMLDLMGPLTDTNPIRFVVNTHADGDHCWGNQLVASSEIISSQACFEEMKDLSPKAFMSLSKLGFLFQCLGRLPGLSRFRVIGSWWREMLAPYDAASVELTLPSRRFKGELTLHVGGREVQLLEVGPMHTRGDIMVYVPDARVLYAGDALFVGVTPVLWAGPLERWIATLDRILQMNLDRIVPGHGPITNGEGVRQLKKYLLLVEDQVSRRFKLGMPPRQAAYDIARSSTFTNSPFAIWDSPERLLVNVYTVYRWLSGHAEPPSLFKRLQIFAEEAEFALTFPNSTPSRLHRSSARAPVRNT